MTSLLWFFLNLFYPSHLRLTHDLICVILWLGSERIVIYYKASLYWETFLTWVFSTLLAHEDFWCSHHFLSAQDMLLNHMLHVFNRSVCVSSLYCSSGLQALHTILYLPPPMSYSVTLKHYDKSYDWRSWKTCKLEWILLNYLALLLSWILRTALPSVGYLPSGNCSSTNTMYVPRKASKN